MNQIGRYWRLLGTAFSFFLFGLGGMIISIVVSPLIFLLIRDAGRRQHITRRMLGHLFIVFLWVMRGLGVLSYKIVGQENVKFGDNKLIVANHPMLIDVIFLVSLFPMAECVVKDAVFKNPAMRGVVGPARYVSARHLGKMINTCVERLRSGKSLMLFPEGTRSVPGQPVQFKLGASSIAIRSEVDILPVVIKCTQPGLLAKNVPWYRVPPQKPFITIHIQEPVAVEELIPGNLSKHESVRALNESLTRYFRKELS